MTTTDLAELAELAEIEGDEAELRHLVATAREHVDTGACEYDGTCAGDAVDAVLEGMTDSQLHNLLHLAIARLAGLGYGLDTADPARLLLADLAPAPDPVGDR